MAFVNSSERFGYDFVPLGYLPQGKDEYWIRNTQAAEGKTWRNLESRELEVLVGNNNTCSNWDQILVSDPFDPSLIRNSHFYGLVRIGALRNIQLQYHDFCIMAGIRSSTIISCDIGDDTAIQDCPYISHFVIGSNCILSRIDEMQTTNHAKFGNGVIKDGEKEEIRISIDVMNEAGGRPILPFEDMITADAYLWACYRDDKELNKSLINITQKQYGSSRGTYGKIGSNSVIKSCLTLKDVSIGEYAYIKGANKLKNISVLSSEDEPSQIGEGVELVNGIVGYGCHVFYGVKAVRFVLGRCSSLKYGAKLIHSVLGDNSTVSCCEILNNLIYPSHEQHHNNSFLIASLIQGMSNIAAGATLGSNHNSRANDGEIRAGRGFWPGLSVTLKHPSRFASFILIAKGDYPYELNISLPFSLVNNNARLDRLEIMPAYFWMYNLYALERNSWKTFNRDKRKIKKQHIEADYLAPDTAEEIITAISKLENWMKSAGRPIEKPQATFSPKVEHEDPEYHMQTEEDTVTAGGLERHNRETMILKPKKAWAAYREMLIYYSLKTLVTYLNDNPELSYSKFVTEMEAGPDNRVSEWVNLGGQIVPSYKIDQLREQIRNGEMNSWDDIHAAYDQMAADYPVDRARHAWEVYKLLDRQPSIMGHPFENSGNLKKELQTLINICHMIEEHVYYSRAKDFDSPFRGITYRNKEEMEQVVGTAKDNSFVKIVRERTKSFEEAIKKLSERL